MTLLTTLLRTYHIRYIPHHIRSNSISFIFTRDSIICYSAYMPRQFRLSVRLSVCHTRALCQNGWTYHRNSFTVWYAHHSSFSSPRVVAQICRLHPQQGLQIQGGSNFRPICGYISETVRDRGIVTMEDEYKVVCALSNYVVFDDLEWPQTPVSRSQCNLKANISQTVHPIHSMSGSRQGFSGSADRMTLFLVR